MNKENKGKYIWAIYYNDGSSEEIYSNLTTFEKFKGWLIENNFKNVKSAIRRN